MQRHIVFFAVLSLLLLACPATSLGRSFYVPEIHPTIQAAIDAAQDGDTVEVGPGIYRETIDFLGKAITVRSIRGPEWTIIDGSRAVDLDRSSVVVFRSGEGPDSVLEGFTITGGRGMLDRGFEPLPPDATATIGPVLESISVVGSSTRYGHGGGIFCLHSSPTILRNEIVGNQALGQNLAPQGTTSYAFGCGGGIFCGVGSAPTIDGNRIAWNQALDAGGGIFCDEGSDPLIGNNLIHDNTARRGGGIFSIADLEAPILVHDTIFANTATLYGGGIACEKFAWQVTITNTIVYGNDAPLHPQIHGDIGSPFLSNCNVEGGWIGEDNIDADPMFLDDAARNLRLRFGSPCVDAGKMPTVCLLDCDCVGECRVLDGNCDGCALPDLGAYELRVPAHEFGLTSNAVPEDRLSSRDGYGTSRYRVCDPIPMFETSDGAVFLERRFDVDYRGGRVILAATFEGIGSVGVNDALSVEILRPDSTGLTFMFDYTQNCSRHAQLAAPHDLTEFFQIGVNAVTVRFWNFCGTKGGATPFWMIVTRNPEDALSGNGASDCRKGNVNALAGATTDVLFVNDEAGSDPLRVVETASGAPITIRMDAPPSCPTGPSRFALYAWLGSPDLETARVLPMGFGISCMPMPLSADGPPDPLYIWNNLGHEQMLGTPTMDSIPAPSVVLSKPNGLGRPGVYFFQGLILDKRSPTTTAAVTNGIVLIAY